jgi:CRISPR-associated endonuclease/helicase Cas3
VRARLQARQACWVVSTQLIEAGVDVDFPLVLRALAPLDSIVQAAGRADREGRRTAELGSPGGEVVVFVPKDNRMPPNEYKEAAGITEQLARQAMEEGEPVQVDSGALISYFARYYEVDELGLGLELHRYRRPKPHEPLELKFATLAREFEMISNRTRDVFVPDNDEARDALEELRAEHFLSNDLRRRLQRHTVGLNPSEFEKARPYLIEYPAGSEVWIASEPIYHAELGLVTDEIVTLPII